MRLVYVFDYMQAEGYVARVPEFLARIWIRRSRRRLDYWTHPDGASPDSQSADQREWDRETRERDAERREWSGLSD